MIKWNWGGAGLVLINKECENEFLKLWDTYPSLKENPQGGKAVNVGSYPQERKGEKGQSLGSTSDTLRELGAAPRGREEGVRKKEEAQSIRQEHP